MKNTRRDANIGQPLPRDENAERNVIGAYLHGAEHESLEPDLIFDSGRQAILVAAVCARYEGGERWPSARSDDYRDLQEAARIRANRIGYDVLQAKTWPGDHDGLNWELLQCVEACTQPALIGYFVEKLLDAWRRRQQIALADRLHNEAYALGSDVGSILENFDIEALRSAKRQQARAKLVSIAAFDPQQVRWLWPRRIARGKLTLLAGQPGLGKSLITVDLAARVSRGLDFPDGASNTGACNVILLSAEDDPSDTIRPRLESAGADLSRIDVLGSATTTDPETGQRRERSVSLADIETLKDALSQRQDCRLLIVDPITAYLDGIDSHRNSDVRAMLAPISTLAHEHDVAILAVTHLNKCSEGGRSALERVSGSLAFAAAARTVWVAGRDKDDPTSSRRIVACAKNNLGPDSSGLSYSITTTADGVPVLTWDPNPVEASADDLLSPPARDVEGGHSALREAIEFLELELVNGPVAAKEMQKRANSAGLSWTGAVRRAKDSLGIRPRKSAIDGGWTWELPEDAQGESVSPQDPG